MTTLGLRSSGRLSLAPRRRAGLAEPPESPGQISALSFWYDAAASPTIETAGAIERWDDLSGNANHAGQPVASERPIKTTDGSGRDVIRFDGIDDTLAATSPPSLAAGVTLFLVFTVRIRADFAGIISAAAASGVDHETFFSLQTGSAEGDQLQWLGRSASVDALSIERGDSGAIGLVILSAANGTTVYRDLLGQSSDTYSGGFGVPAEIVLAGHYDNGTFGFSAVDAYELGLYNRALTAGERSALYDYLANKYGL